MPSLLLERYQIFDKLSSRDLKTTFLAEDLQVGSHVIIKCLKPTHDNNIASDLRVELFRKEVDVIKKIGTIILVFIQMVQFKKKNEVIPSEK